jgi:hypothetical protein
VCCVGGSRRRVGDGRAGRVCLGDNPTYRKIDQDDEVAVRRKQVRPASSSAALERGRRYVVGNVADVLDSFSSKE